MSNEFLKDGTSAIEWAKLNKPLFNYLADKLKLRDPTNFSKMKDTPWLDNIVWYTGLNLGQNAQRAIKRRKRKGETSSDWEDKEEVKVQKVGGLCHGLAVNEGQTKSGKPHKDYSDAKQAFNCVFSYGDWQGGEIILWDLKQKVQLKEGQAVFFQGRIIIHNACRIVGVRNYMDLCIHETLETLDNKNKKHSSNKERNQKRKRRSSC